MNSPLDLKAVVESVAGPIQATGTADPPRAAAETLLAADAHPRANCYGLAAHLVLEIDRPSVTPPGHWTGQATYVRFSPSLTAVAALAVIRHVVLPGPEHEVYALTADECQQAVYLGSDLAKVTGSASLGAFVELSSGHGVGRTRYDARLVDLARITVLGAIGGEPCS